MISRGVAYHGTPQGALSITGIPAAKEMFEPLVPGAHKVPNTNFYRAPEHLATTSRRSAAGPPTGSSEAIEFEGPDTVAAVFLEPVQNSGGCFPPPPGYFAAGPRDLRPSTTCCSSPTRSSARSAGSATMFACDDFGYVPDIITCAKGMTSRLLPASAR